MSISKYSVGLDFLISGKVKKDFDEIQEFESEGDSEVARMLIHKGMDEYDRQRGINKSATNEEKGS